MDEMDELKDLEVFLKAEGLVANDFGWGEDDEPDVDDIEEIEDDEDDLMEDPREGTPLYAVMKENGLLTLDWRERYGWYDRSNPGCSEENPIVISLAEDYVDLEYKVLVRLLRPVPFRFVDYQVEKQRLLHRGERYLDVLTVRVYTHPLLQSGDDGMPFRPEREFLGTEEYWFDITAGFDAIAARHR